jgi:hypothetical protein
MPRRRRPAKQQAIDDYAATYCMSLVEVAAERRVGKRTRTRLDREWKRARGAGATERQLLNVEGWCEREMAPQLRKIYGVEVRRQGILFDL